MEIISYNGKTDLPQGTFHEFSLKVGRWEFEIFADITDTNREKLDVQVFCVLSENGYFTLKQGRQAQFDELVQEYISDIDEQFRDSEQDWAEYYAELNEY
jgi:hypothetical protein